ncbi:MAG: hypothetical protein MPN21_14050 [Thermoanaerobaculia bacterium]|nr:hypothetical protein [Thermoanaerobaculia bacterium]
MTWLGRLFRQTDDEPELPSSPPELLARWNALFAEGERAIQENDVGAFARVAVAAAPVRRAIDRLDPLEVLRSAGADGFRQVLPVLDDDRAFVWRLLAAAELAATNRADEGLGLLDELPTPRISPGAEPFLATLLPPLLAADPCLAVRLTAAGHFPGSALELLGASGELETIRAVGAAFEESPHVQSWENHIVRGARRENRGEVIEALLPVVTRDLPVHLSRTSPKTAESRRQTMCYQAGLAHQAAGNVEAALSIWDRLENRFTLQFQVGSLAEAGFLDEARRLVDMLPEEVRDEARAELNDESVEESTAGNTEIDLEHGLRALDRGEVQEAEDVLDGLRDLAKSARGPRKAWRLLDVVQLAASLERPDVADTALASISKQAEKTRSEKNRVSLELALSLGQLALGHLEEGVDRLLRRCGDVEDHDEAYDLLQRAVDVVRRRGVEGLETLLSALPEPSEEYYLRERLVAYVAADLADEGHIDRAFAAAESLDDSIDRDYALELLTMTFVRQARLGEAKQAALGLNGSIAAHRLGEVATAYARADQPGEARRLFDLALGRAKNLTSAGQLIVEAATVGVSDEGRALVASSLPELLGEPSADEDQRWLKAALRDSRELLRGRPVPRHWQRNERIYETSEDQVPATPGRDRIRALASRARWLASQQREEGARQLVTTAVREWLDMAETDDPLRHSQQAESVALLAVAAAELEEGRESLLAGLRALVSTFDIFQDDDLRSRWRREAAEALGRLGSWEESLRLARRIAAPLERLRALQWLALEIPLSETGEGGWTALLAEAPVHHMFLARLGREHKAARRIAKRALPPVG